MVEVKSYLRNELPIKERIDVYGGKFLVIAMSKRKAWNKLLKLGGIIQPNKRYILFEGNYWHNNTLIPYLVSGL